MLKNKNDQYDKEKQTYEKQMEEAWNDDAFKERTTACQSDFSVIDLIGVCDVFLGEE